MPKIIVGYIAQVLIVFFYGIFLGNMGFVKEGPYVFDDRTKMMNWVAFTLIFWMFFKSAQRFARDFQALLSTQYIDEAAGLQYQQKLRTTQIGLTLIFGSYLLFLYAQDPDDKRVYLSYMCLGLGLATAIQAKMLEGFYKVENVLDAKKIVQKSE